jgi:hypothetical protein
MPSPYDPIVAILKYAEDMFYRRDGIKDHTAATFGAAFVIYGPDKDYLRLGREAFSYLEMNSNNFSVAARVATFDRRRDQTYGTKDILMPAPEPDPLASGSEATPA